MDKRIVNVDSIGVIGSMLGMDDVKATRLLNTTKSILQRSFVFVYSIIHLIHFTLIHFIIILLSHNKVSTLKPRQQAVANLRKKSKNLKKKF